jgi:hypothetical protein
MLLSDRVRDGETVQIRFDGPHNRLYIVPNHKGNADMEGMDIDMDDDYIDIEEID